MYIHIYIYTLYKYITYIYIYTSTYKLLPVPIMHLFPIHEGKVKQGKFPMVTGYCSMSTLLSSSMQRRHTFWNHGGLVTTLGSKPLATRLFPMTVIQRKVLRFLSGCSDVFLPFFPFVFPMLGLFQPPSFPHRDRRRNNWGQALFPNLLRLGSRCVSITLYIYYIKPSYFLYKYIIYIEITLWLCVYYIYIMCICIIDIYIYICVCVHTSGT